MNSVEYAKLIRFIEKNVYCNQTYVVHTLLRKENKLDLDSCLHNGYIYSIFNGSGHVKIKEPAYMSNIDSAHRELKQIQIKQEQMPAKNDQDIEKLEKRKKQLETDIKIFEDATSSLIPIFEWWLVPFWLSEKLLEKGETILRAYECCWWGRTEDSKTVPLDKALRDIAKPYIKEGEYLNVE